MAGVSEKRSDFQQVDARIYDALVELLSEKSLVKITVTDIAARAGVSRAAFYLM